MRTHTSPARIRPTLPAVLAATALALLLTACRGDAQARDGSAAREAAADTVQPGEVQLGHTLGDPHAPIAVVEFSDFGCPYCARFARTTLPAIRQEYIDTGLVRWRYVPIVFGFPGGQLMGAAAVCAAQQGGGEAFWSAHDILYERQVALRGEDARPRLLQWLGEAGLDTDALDACIDHPATTERLQRHTLAARDWFVRGTPTFLINGVPMAGALPIAFFRTVFATVLDPSGL